MKFEAPKFDEHLNPNIPHGSSQWREVRAMLGYMLLTLLAVWLIIEAIVWSLPYTVSLPRERAWFAFVGEHILQDEQTQRDPAMQQLANQLATHMGLPENSVDVYISEEDTPNAFATFGGNVVLYRGLLNRLPNEESVAAVLAHEMGHIKNRDPLRGMSRSLLYSVVMSALGGDAAHIQPLIHLEGLRYSREMENKADRMAMDAIHKQYRSVAGVKDLFRTLHAVEQEHNVGNHLTWLSTHPDTEQRIAQVDAFAEQLHIGNTPAQLPNRWQKK